MSSQLFQKIVCSVSLKSRWNCCCVFLLQNQRLARCFIRLSSSNNNGKEHVSLSNINTKVSFMELKRRGILKKRRKLSPTDRIAAMIDDNPEPPKTENVSSADEKTIKLDDNDTQRMTRPIHDKTDRHTMDYFKMYKEIVVYQTKLSLSKLQEEEHDSDDQYKQGAILKQWIDSQTSNFGCHKEHPGDTAYKYASEATLVDGEFVIVAKEKGASRLVKLEAGNGFIQTLPHNEIIGAPSGATFMINMHEKIIVKRPSLQEFLKIRLEESLSAGYHYHSSFLTMISIMSMTDVNTGDVVLEIGTGPGFMTLLLSKAVSRFGHVHSFEGNKSERTGAQNYHSWRNSYNLSQKEMPWPENVTFYQEHLTRFPDKVDCAIFNHRTECASLQIMSEKLKWNKSAVVCLSSLQEVEDIVRIINKNGLPFHPEEVLEVRSRNIDVSRFGCISVDRSNALTDGKYSKAILMKLRRQT